MEIILAIVLIIVFLAMTNALNIFDSIVIVDIFLRILNFIFALTAGVEVVDRANEIIPDSLLEPIKLWTDGSIYMVLIGIYIVCYAAFVFTFIKRIIKRK